MLLSDATHAEPQPGAGHAWLPAGPGTWSIARHADMRVAAQLYGDAATVSSAVAGGLLQQLADVAALPGVVEPVIALPEVQPGYGFPIGVVAAFDARAGGVVVPGGIGYDINCGVRLLRSAVGAREAQPRIGLLLDGLLERGVCAPVQLTPAELASVLAHGANWAVAHGCGIPADVDPLDWRGALPEAEPRLVSPRGLERGANQLGTLGSGNHFIEIGWVERVFDPAAAAALGLEEGTVTVLIHSGSRGLGHEVCADGVEQMLRAAERYRIRLADRQLACAPLASQEGRQFLGAMAAAANYGFANRQVLTQRVRELFGRTYSISGDAHGLSVVCDSPHNLASCETHTVAGRELRLCVHRRGAVRALPPGHASLSGAARALGQPVVLPGDMGRYSMVLLPDSATADTFNSLPHGAGRRVGRAAAARQRQANDCRAELAAAGVEVRTSTPATLEETAPEAYRELDGTMAVLAGAHLARAVARLRPLGVVRC